MALSHSGSTLAVGAYLEDSNSRDIDGDGGNNAAADSGPVYIFSSAGENWQQQVYLKAPNADAGDQFGKSLALSASGNRLLIGAEGERSTKNALR